MVCGKIYNSEFKAVLEPDGTAGHFLELDQDFLIKIKANVGDELAIELEPTSLWVEPKVPQDFQIALEFNFEAKSLWDKITPAARHEWIRWISSTNNIDTRAKRIEVSMSKLKSGMKRPCCFNSAMYCNAKVSKKGVLLT